MGESAEAGAVGEGAVAGAPAVLEGQISIEAALQAGSREVHRILIRRDKPEDAALSRLLQRARAKGVPVQRVSQATIAEHATGQSHGGVIALVGPRRFLALEDLVARKVRPCVVMLDGVEDPFNFGDATRSLYAAGIDGLVVRPRNWTSAAGIVGRASAGASELMPMAVAETALDAAAFFRARGLALACAVKRRAISIYEADLSGALFLVIGGEKRGISRALVDQADLLLQIPYGRPFAASLGTAAATAVMAFEIQRQRRLRGLAGER
jgi:23S rRNA (guanosine2251-2'-O)-methyltransferase